MRYFIIAGEASGDLHGAGLIRALREQDPLAEFVAWGGEHMEEAGALILKHYRTLAFMGFVEVAMNLPAILRNFRSVKEQIRRAKPNALILIDYPGFNLRMARWAHHQEIPVHYYISPQLWAWKEGRVELVRRYVDKMYVILPFEQNFYGKHGIEVEYVGHPLLEVIGQYRRKHPAGERETRNIALIAGSRKQEVRHMLPVMLGAAAGFPDYSFQIAAAPHVPHDLYTRIVEYSGIKNVSIVQGQTYNIMQRAYAALTTSGTATLEMALFETPQVVCYKGNPLSFQIARRLVKVPYISLVNLIAGHKVVEELIQDKCNSSSLTASLERILDDEIRARIMTAYQSLQAILDAGGASTRTAQSIIASLQNTRNASV